MGNDQMQFGITPGSRTANAIFVLRQLQEKHLAKKKNLYFTFLDLAKALDKILEMLQKKKSFLVAVCRKRIGSNFVPCQFSRCWVRKKYRVVRAKLKEDKNFECQAFANQRTDLAEDCPSIESNDQSLEIIEIGQTGCS